MKHITKFLIFSILAVFLLTGSVWATPVLTLSYKGNTKVVLDGSAVNPVDTAPLPGVVSYDGPVFGLPINPDINQALKDAWVLNETTGVSKPFLGGPTTPRMDLSSLNISSLLVGGTLTITWTDYDFASVGYGFTSSIGGTTDGSVDYKTEYNQGDVNNPADWIVLSQFNGMTPFIGDTFGASANAGVTINNPFALRMTVSITHEAGLLGASAHITSFDAHLRPVVPEPATMLLFGVGLLGLGAVGRKKFIKK